MYRIIHANFAHHHPATPLKKVGRWNVYLASDVEEGWPNNGHTLALGMGEEQILWLEENDGEDPYEQWELPSTPISEETSA